ncbi:MAG TPA: orotidine-5'-phosphate decarboxylase [bacterium]|nr:orotidine-5'-phosphate decarboxylase [bacterium]HOL48014.1 orotidine-5'-phosphate decarboxylase [bacterium]HPQ19316.1 orotidine-5'-phosphate decarboxylase [bacterium]
MYKEKLKARIKKVNSRLCVGLDPRPESSEKDIRNFLFKLIDETKDNAAVFKPNIAYFEAMGKNGYEILFEIIEYIKKYNVPIILDVKRSDIGETQKYYAKAYFQNMDVDAVTLNPYLGSDSIEPFLYENKGIYLLGITSNKGAKEIQQLEFGGKFIFEYIFEQAKKLNSENVSVGLVVGLTNINDLIIPKIPDVPLLIPGLGAQGGNLEIVKSFIKKLDSPIVINVSRGILYDEKEKSFYEKSLKYKEQINELFR